MARPSSLSGFPEWLPEGRIVEQHILDLLRTTFELHGFVGVRTRAVEPLGELLRKGETSKEVYVLHRLQEEVEGGEHGLVHLEDQARRLGLHFDLTVPFARYVLENAGHLTFPFKRHQIQSVWRGERPQDGRFREFIQADIDIVGEGSLAFHHEIEAPLVMAEALGRLGLGEIRVRVNNRKVSQGFYEAIGLADVEGVLRVVDKLGKLGPAGVSAELQAEVGASEEQARRVLELAAISGEDASVAERVRALGASSELLEEGLAELVALVEGAAEVRPGVVVADLTIARGLDYYTGSVYETELVGHEDLGSICSGGRYDSLASDGKRTFPGVGLSIGVSRLVSRVLSAGLLTASRSVPTAVLVAVWDEEHRAASEAVARALRERGIPADTAPSAAKLGKQIKVADRRGIPFVWFPPQDAEGTHAVKDIRSGAQVAADAASWAPPAEDLWPTVHSPRAGNAGGPR